MGGARLNLASNGQEGISAGAVEEGGRVGINCGDEVLLKCGLEGQKRGG